jgi:arylsulfatase A-like enzyme
MLNRRRFFTTPLSAPLLRGQQRRPNILFLFSDDHHFQCLGAAGNPHIRTPHLDSLAAGGVHFTNGLISTSQCCPSRGVILSGLESYQSGLISNGATSFRPGAVRKTVVQQMRDSGYDTVHIGKWHITPPPGASGFERSPLWLRGGGSVYRDPLLRHGQQGRDEKTPGHITDLFTGAAIAEIRRAKQPYFLWLAYNAPHTPWYAAEKYFAPYAGMADGNLAPPLHPPGGAKFDWRTYYAVITHLDEAIGRLVAAVKESGQWDDTVLFFLGDNGYMAGTRNWSGKVRHWDESVRVPYLVSGGWVKHAGKVADPVASVDAAATWLDIAGVKPVQPLAGRSLASYLRTGRGPVREAYSAWDDPRPEGLAVRVAVEPYRLVRTGRHKLVVFESKRQSLYDCVRDPGETADLIGDPEHAALRGELQAKLRQRMRETADRALAWMD